MLCVKGKLFDVLTSIADDLDISADPEVFIRWLPCLLPVTGRGLEV